MGTKIRLATIATIANLAGVEAIIAAGQDGHTGQFRAIIPKFPVAETLLESKSVRNDYNALRILQLPKTGDKRHWELYFPMAFVCQRILLIKAFKR